MVYFDNAATSYPKPRCVIQAAVKAAVCLGGNPGRSGHDMSLRAAAAVYSVRERAAEFFGAAPENVIFTSNCTNSINLAVKGFLKANCPDLSGVRVITGDLEHNSVARPLWEMAKRGLNRDVVHIHETNDLTVSETERLITPETKAVVCTLGSNVTGQLLPFGRIGEVCRKKNICFIADGAQVCGIMPVDLARDNINILCCPGHKGLMGLTGTGLIITDGKYPITHIIEGGTGSTSNQLEQTPFLPEMLESGTVNVPGIVSVGAGLDFLKKMGMERIHAYEQSLCRILMRELGSIRGVTVYRTQDADYLPIVLFNAADRSSEETAAFLNSCGFALRGGLHCAPMAHNALGTIQTGGVRFSPSCFNTAGQVYALAEAVRKFVR